MLFNLCVNNMLGPSTSLQQTLEFLNNCATSIRGKVEEIQFNKEELYEEEKDQICSQDLSRRLVEMGVNPIQPIKDI